MKRSLGMFLFFLVLVFCLFPILGSAKYDYEFGEVIVGEDEGNNSRDWAADIYSGNTISGGLWVGDVDVFEFKIYKSARMEIIVEAGDPNTVARVINEAGEVIAVPKANGNQGENTLQTVSRHMERGRYYLYVFNKMDKEDNYLLYYFLHEHEHNWEVVSHIQEPLCNRVGYITYTCDCGENYIEEYGTPTGVHRYGSYISDNNGSPEEQGTKSAYCVICGDRSTVDDIGVHLPNVLQNHPTPHLTGNIVSWSAAEGADFYQVFRLENDNWKLLANTRGLAYKDETAPMGVKSYYKVRARNGNLMSSMAVYSMEAIRPKLNEVAITGITEHHTGNIICWDADANAQFYQVYRLEGSSWKLLANTGKTAYKDETAPIGIKAYYKIVARNGNYKSDIAKTCSESAVRPAPVSHLETVSITEVVGHRTGNIIRWNAVENAVLYQVYRLNGSSWELLTNTGGLAYKDETALVGVRTYYKVVARNGNTTSDISETRSDFGVRAEY